MKCEECRDLLWIYLEWETTPEESAEIKAHLAECPKCRKAASQHMAVMETLRSLPEAELPEGYHALCSGESFSIASSISRCFSCRRSASSGVSRSSAICNAHGQLF